MDSAQTDTSSNSSSEEGGSQTAAAEEVRNWAELQPDLLLIIFQKLGCIEVLLRVQSVCSSWMRLTYEPQLWRHADFRNPWSLLDDWDGSEVPDKMVRIAIDRSCGQCVQLSVENFATDDLLQYAMDKLSVLQSLRLISCYNITDEKLIEVAKKFPQLEELEISYCSFGAEALENVGKSCPQLKYLRLNCQGTRPGFERDEEAFAIAKNMPELRRLRIFSNLTDVGLRAILDGCPLLESLDLRQCFNLTFGGGLKNRCMDKLRELRLPNDPTDDYEYDAGILGYGSYDEDYPSGISEIDFISDDGSYEFSDGGIELSDFEF